MPGPKPLSLDRLSRRGSWLAKPRRKAAAKMLRGEDAKKWTQAKVAAALGVARNTISDWFGSNVGADNTSVRPDARVKVPPKQRPVMAARVSKGESVSAVAADYGISERQARTIVTKEKKQAAEKKKRETPREAEASSACGVDADALDGFLAGGPRRCSRRTRSRWRSV